MSKPTRNQTLALRFYAWLLQLYPKDFRAKFGNEMLQAFRDRWGDELDQASSFRKLAFWGEITIDFLTTATFEYLSKGENMENVEKDLRWDLRYGVQLFLRHSAVVLKCVTCAGISLLALYAIAIITVALYSSVEARRTKEVVNQTWIEATGQTPQESYESILKRFPKAGKNKSAIELETISVRLGIDIPESGSEWESQGHGRIEPFSSTAAANYLYTQLVKPFDEIDIPPSHIKEYLTLHHSDLDELYNRILQDEVPRWEIDIQKGYGAPVPNLLFHQQLHSVLALDILEKTRLGRHNEALEAFEASWKISQSLRDRPEMISYQISLQLLNLQTGVLRKMKQAPHEWQERISSVNLIDSMFQSMTLDTEVINQEMPTTLQNMPDIGWEKFFLIAPLSGPLRSLMAMRNLKLTGEAISDLHKTGLCDFAAEPFEKFIRRKRYRWALPNHWFLVNSYQPFAEILKTSLYIELTQKILETRGDFANLKLNRPESEDVIAKSSLCSGTTWIREISPEGTIHIHIVGIPEWMRQEDRLSRLPLEYSLRIKNL